MGQHTNISWCDHTFNLAWGCTKVSRACVNCYAETWARRHGVGWGPSAPRRTFGAKHWAEPLAWNRAAARAGVRRRVFASSMCDIYEDHPTIEAERVKLWRLVEQCDRLDWLFLTKRVDRMAEEFAEIERRAGGVPFGQLHPNVWAGTTVEDQRRFDERAPQLAALRSVVTFLSMEPLLSAVDMTALLPAYTPWERACPERWSEFAWPEWVPVPVQEQIVQFWDERWGRGPVAWVRDHRQQGSLPFGMRGTFEVLDGRTVEGRWVHAWNNLGRVITDDGSYAVVSIPRAGLFDSRRYDAGATAISWVIVGGESGRDAEPTHPDWFRSIRDQCQDAGVPFLFKQWGEWAPADAGNVDRAREDRVIEFGGRDSTDRPISEHTAESAHMVRIGKMAAGSLLDGRAHLEFPDPLRSPYHPRPLVIG